MKNRGFSLIELMIVVAIIMILGAGGMWTLKDRLYRNEIIKVRASVPTLLNSGTLRVYERGTSEAALTVTGGSISISNIGSGMEVRSRMFTFSTSPASVNLAINELGGFPEDFDILVKDRNNSNVMTFKIATKSSFGVFRVDVINH